jgi:hypothetical protein
MPESAARPVVLCIDVEPDERVCDPAAPSPWLGFERCVENLPRLRDRLAESTGRPVAFTWFLRMDEQVEGTWGSRGWAAGAYGELFEGLVREGDELGLHTHPWRWDVNAGDWYADYADAAWAAASLDAALDAFEHSFGRPCEAHRGGDHHLDGVMLERLGSRGVRVDLTVEPGQRPGGAVGGEASRGAGPDYRGLPTTPYRSSPERFPQPDARGDGPLLIPLVSALGSRRFGRTPIPPASSPARFIPRLELELLSAAWAPPVLAFAVRSDAGLGPLWDALERNLLHLARRHDVEFVSATTALEQLERPPALAESRG